VNGLDGMSELEDEPPNAMEPDEFTAAVLELVMAMERDRIARADGYIPICDDLMLASMERGRAMPSANASDTL